MSTGDARFRILLVARRSAPATGGVESYLQHVSRGLSDAGHSVTLVAQRIDNGPTQRLTESLRPPPSFAPFRDGDVAVVPLRFSATQRLRMAPAVGQVVPGLRRYAYGSLRIPMAASYARVAAPQIAAQARAAEVVHVWASDFIAVAGVRAAQLAGRPVLVTPFVHAGSWGDDPASARAFRRADRAIGLLQDDCRVLRTLGVDPARVVECPVCSPGVARGGGVAWRASHGVDGPLVAFLGVRRPYKGYDLLVDALPELAARMPSATVVFAGPGERIAPEQAVRVIDRGAVDEDERAALLDAADVLCLPSAGEIFPVTILEAWSAATAVLTSDIPPLAELMSRSGGGATTARTATAIARSLAEMLSGDHRAMAQRGRAYWLAHATVQAVVQRHVDLYRDAIAEHAAGVAGARLRA